MRFPEDPRITWVQQDIRTVSLDGYDLIVNLGLFYHLTLDDQLFLLDRAAGRPMILDTHVANNKPTKFVLSEPVSQKGYSGQFYSEANKQHHPTASWGNASSFWPTPASLRKMLNERGWDVYTMTPFYLPDRTFYLCQPRKVRSRSWSAKGSSVGHHVITPVRRLRKAAKRALKPVDRRAR